MSQEETMSPIDLPEQSRASRSKSRLRLFYTECTVGNKCPMPLVTQLMSCTRVRDLIELPSGYDCVSNLPSTKRPLWTIAIIVQAPSRTAVAPGNGHERLSLLNWHALQLVAYVYLLCIYSILALLSFHFHPSISET